MNITCQHCKTKLSIPDHKLPQDREATLKCPKCKGQIRIPAEKADAAVPDSFESAPLVALGERQSAMLCIDAKDVLQTVTDVVKQVGFSIQMAGDTKNALRDMEYHIYDLVVLDEAFDKGQGLSRIMEKMNAMDMSSRRRICLLLVSKTFPSNDNMAAIHNSVNSIINYQDITYLGTFLLKVLTDHKNFYTVYNESLKQAGKA